VTETARPVAVQLVWTHSTEPWDADTLRAARALVPEPVLAQMPRYRRWQDVQMGLCGKLLLSHLLAAAGLERRALASLTWDEHRRPVLPLDGDFNLSHSGGLVACARGVGLRLGLDVEHIHPVPVEDIAFALGAGERQKLARAADPQGEFFRMWTFKEAVIKADGRGVGMDLKSVDSSRDVVEIDGWRWHVRRLRLHEGYDAHLACDRAEARVELAEVPLGDLLR
jgi:4'-phosphopantetheinyl transferase